MNILDNNFQQQVGSLLGPSLFYNRESANEMNALEHLKRILENEQDVGNSKKFLSMLLITYIYIYIHSFLLTYPSVKYHQRWYIGT